MSGNAVHLPGFLDSLRPVLDQYGYLAVTGFVLLEDFGVPVPGETILILGAVYAGTGRLQIWLVGLLGFLGAVVGDNIGFAIGHFGGRALVERYGRYVFLTPERLDKTTDFFERHGGKIIIVARFIEGLRQANGIIAGISGMHWARFVVFNAIGAALWVGVWTSVGYFSGNHLTSIYNAFTSAGVYALIAAGVLLAAYIAWRVRRARRRRAEREAAPATETQATPEVNPSAVPPQPAADKPSNAAKEPPATPATETPQSSEHQPAPAQNPPAPEGSPAPPDEPARPGHSDDAARPP
jgi:membrane protein DedA with SNARE-associated domain